MNYINKKVMAKFGDFLSNIASGKITGYNYPRYEIPEWSMKENEYLFISNINIIDVDSGKIMPVRGLLVKDKQIDQLVLQEDFDKIRESYPIKQEINGENKYLIPGLSDIHGHLSLISEFELGLKQLRYFDAQRQKNCEEALKSGCTFVKDSGGAINVMDYLRHEIENDRLLGPKMMAAKETISPKGGMWDLGIFNKFAPMIFGGRVLNFPKNTQELEETIDWFNESGSDFFKTYFEDKPIYGGKESDVFNMFTPEHAALIRKKATAYNKMVEAHSMFIKGSRRVIDAKFDFIAHFTVDEPYSPEDAQKMKNNNVAVIPTLSLGCYFAMNCGEKGFPNHPDFQFFKEKLNNEVPAMMVRCTIPQLRNNYLHFAKWIDQYIEDRKMPSVGQVYPERVHGFIKNAQESLNNLHNAGVKIGIGTDGGSGITFVGNLQIEFEALEHFGFTPAEILRMATLGNMEIIHLEKKLGSIEKGKFADMVILDKNPLNDAKAITSVSGVFKNGRLYFRQKEVLNRQQLSIRKGYKPKVEYENK
ncbi:MAG: amidohydrolase family protein [Desulfobacterales bacterium]